MTRTVAADAVLPACRHAVAARCTEAFAAIACTGPASRTGPPGRPRRPLLHPLRGAAGERNSRYVRPLRRPCRRDVAMLAGWSSDPGRDV
jgi:hypothetical protein